MCIRDSITPNDDDLEDLFADLAANISKPGATNIVLDEVLNPDFAITSILMPIKGTATMINATSLRWTIEMCIRDRYSAGPNSCFW